MTCPFKEIQKIIAYHRRNDWFNGLYHRDSFSEQVHKIP